MCNTHWQSYSYFILVLPSREPSLFQRWQHGLDVEVLGICKVEMNFCSRQRC